MSTIIPQNFVKTVQDDFATVFNKKEGASTKLDARVASAALGLITTVGMAIASLYLLFTLPLLKVGCAVAGVAICRDWFVISQNAAANLNVFVRTAGEVSNKIRDLKDQFLGKKEAGEAPSHPLTENTIFRTLWDKMGVGPFYDKHVLLPFLNKQAEKLPI